MLIPKINQKIHVRLVTMAMVSGNHSARTAIREYTVNAKYPFLRLTYICWVDFSFLVN